MWICPLETSTFTQINVRQEKLSNTEDEGVDSIAKLLHWKIFTNRFKMWLKHSAWEQRKDSGTLRSSLEPYIVI